MARGLRTGAVEPQLLNEGGKAVLPHIPDDAVSGIPAVRLPSTSPANAACRPEKLREIWQKELSNWILP